MTVVEEHKAIVPTSGVRNCMRGISWSRWSIGPLAIALIVMAPILSLIVLAFMPEENIWPHLLASVLPGAVRQTALLMLGVGVFALMIGTVSAWLITMYDFPGRRFLAWALLVPLAIPTYLSAFCYAELMDYSGPLQTGLRAAFGWQDATQYWFPEIRSLIGAAFVMAFVLYPYVYLTARASFVQQSAGVLEAARTLGHSPIGAFREVALPLARPALVAGVALALMECLNDIGAVEYFGVQTLTVSVYATWLERSNLGGAAQIAVLMLVLVIALYGLERSARRGQRYHNQARGKQHVAATRLTGFSALLATFACTMPVLIGFVLPASVLVRAALIFPDDAATAAFWLAAENSIMLALMAAALAVIVGLILGYARRVEPSPVMETAVSVSSIGYAVPGTILAVGIMIPLAAFDNAIDELMRSTFGVSTGLLLSGSVFALVLAYTVRFLAVSLGSIEAGFKRVSPNIDAAARTLGATRTQTLRRVLVPMLNPALGAAALLVFVDAMKELPATLLLRPFNFETLATHVYSLAGLDQFEEAAISALTIVVIGLLPVILLHRAFINAASSD